MKKYKMKRGFSLIEVMVVIVVLGVLSGIAVPKIMGYTEKTKEKADLMKLYCLRDALNRDLLENDAALYKSSFVSSGKQAADMTDRVHRFLLPFHPP